MQELAKYKACAKETRRGTSVCYFQVQQRDASGYLHSLWASLLRSPDAFHTAVSASTYYLDQVRAPAAPKRSARAPSACWRVARQELTFREDAVHIHAGFAYLNAGAFFLRQHAAEFLARAAPPRACRTPRSTRPRGGRAPLARAQRAAGGAGEPHRAARRQIGEPQLVECKAYERRSRTEARPLALKLLSRAPSPPRPHPTPPPPPPPRGTTGRTTL